MKMEIRDGINRSLAGIEEDEERRQHLRAFWDFCCDLLQEEYGRMTLEDEIDPRFVRGLIMAGESALESRKQN